MSIYFECNRDQLDHCMLRAETALYETGKAINGYQSGLAHDVYKQMEALYMEAKEMRPGLSTSKQFSGDWSFVDHIAYQAVMAMPERVKGFSALYTALLYQAGLHPVFIPCKEDILVGAWLYEDYDYQTSIIRSEEFLEESYDKGGMLLLVSVVSMALDKSFSETLTDGCKSLINYICAVDIVLENKELSASMILESFSDDTYDEEEFVSAHVCDDEAYKDCVEILRKSDESFSDEELRLIVSNENCRALIKGEKSKLDSLRYSHMDKDRALAYAGDEILNNLRDNTHLFVLSDSYLKNQLYENLKKNGLDAFVLDLNNKEQEEEKLQTILSLQPMELSRRQKMAKRLYDENKKKCDHYMELLESDTIPGLTLISLLEEASEVESSKLKMPLGTTERQVIFSSDHRSVFERFCSVCLDLTSFSDEEISRLREMLMISETVANNFLLKFYDFSVAVSMTYNEMPEISQKEFSKNLMAVNDFCIACLDYKVSLGYDELPQATEAELLLCDSYKDYVKYRNILATVDDGINLAAFKVLSAEDCEKLKNLSESLLRFELESIGTMVPRAVTKACQELEDILKYYKVIEEKDSIKGKNAGSRYERIISICNALKEPELIKRNADDPSKLGLLYQFFADTASKDPFILNLQNEIVMHYKYINDLENISDSCREIVNDLMRAVTKDISLLTHAQSDLLLLSDELLNEYYTPFHAMEKEIFEFVGLSYKLVDQAFPDKTLLDFILDWKNMFEENQEYDIYQHENAAILRSCLGDIYKQIKDDHMSPEEAKEAFNNFWLLGAVSYWTEKLGFDYSDYELTTQSLKGYENTRKEVEKIHCFNELLEMYQNKQERQGLTVFLAGIDEANAFLRNHGRKVEKLLITDPESLNWTCVLLPMVYAKEVEFLLPETLSGSEADMESAALRFVTMGIDFSEDEK